MRKALLITGALLAAALIVAVTATVVRMDIPDLGIDLNLPDLDESTPTGYWYPTIVNETGANFEDATLTIFTNNESRRITEVQVGDSPDSVQKLHEDSVPVTDEKCRIPTTNPDSYDFQPSGPGPTSFPVSTSVECVQDVVTGNAVYSLWIGALGDPYGGFDDGHAFKVTVKAVLTVDGKTLKKIEERLIIEPTRS